MVLVVEVLVIDVRADVVIDTFADSMIIVVVAAAAVFKFVVPIS